MSGRVELRVPDVDRTRWLGFAAVAGLSLSEFIRRAVEEKVGGRSEADVTLAQIRQLLDGRVSVAAGPPVVEAERVPVDVAGLNAGVARLRDLAGVVVAAEVGFAPVAPAASPVQAKPFGSSGKKSYEPDFRPGSK